MRFAKRRGLNLRVKTIRQPLTHPPQTLGAENLVIILAERFIMGRKGKGNRRCLWGGAESSHCFTYGHARSARTPAKKTYIPLDSAQEARRINIPYGRIFDPVGKPVERGYSIVPWTRAQGKDYNLANAFLSCFWSEGTDPGTNSGLRKIVERYGLDWNAAKDIVGNQDWQTEAEANSAEMMTRGIWDVPSFRVGNTITWGQDRLWVIEHALQKLAG